MSRCKNLYLIFALLLPLCSLGQSVKYRQAPNWVQPIQPAYEASNVSGESGGVYYLLIDRQENVSEQEKFEHYSYKLLNADGVQNQSDISVSFDPSYQTLIIHNVNIIREGNVLTKLDKDRVQVIQREQNMDRHLYDGTLTAVLNLQDIRVGDVIDYSFTIRGYNPIIGGHIARNYYFNYSLPVEKLYERLLIPKAKELKIKNINTPIKPEVMDKGLMLDYVWQAEKVAALLVEQNYPSWFDPYAKVEVSDMTSWSQVVEWGVKHFSLTTEEQNKIKDIANKKWSSSIDKDDFVVEVIRFVQDEIRYLGFEMGLNSHQPHSPLTVYNQRFGDCKDKSLLMASLLQSRGVEARPMLINTELKHRMKEQLPSINSFNHCVVELELDGKRIYIDPTISSQGGKIDNYYFPTYDVGLVIKKGITQLSAIPLLNRGEIVEDHFFAIDEINGAANWEVRTAYKGIDADIQRSRLSSTSLESLQKDYLAFYGNLYSAVQVTQPMKVEDDRDLNILVLKEYYTVPDFWKENEDVENQIYAEFYPISMENYFNIAKYSERKAPYPLSFPTLHKHTIQVTLPEPWSIPDDGKTINSDYYSYEYKVRYNAKNRMLTINHNYETLKDHVTIEDVPDMVEDHKQMMNDLSYFLTFPLNANKFKLSILMIGIGVLIVAAAGFGAYLLYYKYDPEPENSILPGENIGGWLFLVGFGLVLTPVMIVSFFVKNNNYFNEHTWNNILSQGIGLPSLVFGEYVFNLCYLVFSILTAVLFFKRRTSLPRLISIGFVVNFVFVVVDQFLANQIASGTTIDWTAILRALIAVVIWVPYFYYSERVKNTFVLRSADNDRNGSTTYTLHR